MEQRVGHDQAEYRVSEELEPLVGRQAAVFVRVRPVRQRPVKQVIADTDLQLTKKDLDAIGAGNEQIKALEEWLLQQEQKHLHPEPEEPIEVSGKHTLV